MSEFKIIIFILTIFENWKIVVGLLHLCLLLARMQDNIPKKELHLNFNKKFLNFEKQFSYNLFFIF